MVETNLQERVLTPLETLLNKIEVDEVVSIT